MSSIRLRGLRAGNLQNADLDLQLGRWTAIHGPSGAGKSALLFGTLEPVAARRFSLLSKPDSLPGGTEDWLVPIADSIQGLPPTLASAGEIPRNRRLKEVGSVLDVWPFLAEQWQLHPQRCCSNCGHKWLQPQMDVLLELARSWPVGVRIHFFSDASGASTDDLLHAGWTRVRLKQTLARLEEAPEVLPAESQLLLDRFKWKGRASEARLAEALSEGLRRGVAFQIDIHGGDSIDIPSSTNCPTCQSELPKRDAAHLAQLTPQESEGCQDVWVKGHPWSAWRNAPFSDWHSAFSAEKSCATTRRLHFISRTGLGHLSASRQLGTLSLGEGRRLELVSWLAQARTGQLLLFDEPGMGLHGSERRDLAALLQELTRQGNTVLTADPAREFLEAADEWVHLGPGGGPSGGQVVAQGNRQELPNADDAPAFTVSKPDADTSLSFSNLQKRHLAIPSLKVPLGRVVAFCGVSGSGKTTLVEHEILPRLRAEEGFEGQLPLGGVRVLLERALGHSLWSTVATLSGAWREIREHFAEGEEGRIRGLSASDFVARPKQGACAVCQGHGVAADGIPCEHCEGLGLRLDLLDLRFRSRSLRQWLTTPLESLEKRLPQEGRLRTLVQHLCRLGLGARTFGERGRHLSLGERGRLALARALASARRGRPQLFLLDEPCLGLPTPDAMRVVELLRSLTEQGHSFWVVEHHEVLLRSADWLIELGPGAGPSGGNLLFEGPPSALESSHTPTAVWFRQSRQQALSPLAWEESALPLSERLQENLALPARRQLEDDLLRELATRSPLLSDALPAQTANDALLPPVAWPVSPPPRTPVISVLGLDALFKEALLEHGQSLCPACRGGGPWPDLLTAVAAQADQGEFVFATPLSANLAAEGATSLLHAAGFRRFLRAGKREKITLKNHIQPGEPVWLDRIHLKTDDDAQGRLLDLEHHSRLLGQKELLVYAPQDLNHAAWVYHPDACRDCAQRGLGVETQLAGLSRAKLYELPLQESLHHFQRHLRQANIFKEALDLLATTDVLRVSAQTPLSQLSECSARCAHLIGWLLSPLDGVVLLASQPLAGLPPKLSRQLADAFSDGRHGVWRWSDAQGENRLTAPTPMAFDLDAWSLPTRVGRNGLLRDALGLTDPLIQHYLRTEEARFRGLKQQDLSSKGALACPKCRANGTFAPHPELRLACPACFGTGWRREAAALEDRGVSRSQLGQMSLEALAEHIAATPALAEVLEAALAFGFHGLQLDEAIQRLPEAVRQWAPLCGKLQMGGSWRLAAPFAGLSHLEAKRIASTMDGFSQSKNDFEQQGHPAMGEMPHD